MTKKTKTSISTSKFISSFKKLMGEGANEFVINVSPVPASRPRVTKWGTYYGKNYERFRRDVRNEIHSHKGKKMFGPIIALVEIICPRPKTIERLFPRGDVDNFAKGPLDSLTSQGSFWGDDDQIVLLEVVKRFVEDNEQPKIIITYKEMTKV